MAMDQMGEQQAQMGEQQAQRPSEQPSKNPRALVAGIHDGMVELMQLMDNPNVPDQAKQQMGQLLQGFRSFVEQTLMGGGEEQAEQRMANQTTTPEQGAADTRPV